MEKKKYYMYVNPNSLDIDFIYVMSEHDITLEKIVVEAEDGVEAELLAKAQIIEVNETMKTFS